jgi:hypothetical protein
MRFSQRIGKTPVTKSLQLESIDSELLNGLWNITKLTFIDRLNTYAGYNTNNEFDLFCIGLWHKFYKLPTDKMPEGYSLKLKFIREKFFSGAWYEVYDFIEYLANRTYNYEEVNIPFFISEINSLLEQEFAGYRFIDRTISPISNNVEVDELETAMNQTHQFTSLKVVNIHLSEALIKLSDRKTPDYRNSIKESISAVESIVKIISNNPKDSLAGALDKIKSKIKIHPALEKGFKQIYGYTSDADGIRHGLMDVSDCDFEDAKFMLVSCSAFINYLIAKSAKAGIIFE